MDLLWSSNGPWFAEGVFMVHTGKSTNFGQSIESGWIVPGFPKFIKIYIIVWHWNFGGLNFAPFPQGVHFLGAVIHSTTAML
jgi:hypothetical protein